MPGGKRLPGRGGNQQRVEHGSFATTRARGERSLWRLLVLATSHRDFPPDARCTAVVLGMLRWTDFKTGEVATKWGVTLALLAVTSHVKASTIRQKVLPKLERAGLLSMQRSADYRRTHRFRIDVPRLLKMGSAVANGSSDSESDTSCQSEETQIRNPAPECVTPRVRVSDSSCRTPSHKSCVSSMLRPFQGSPGSAEKRRRPLAGEAGPPAQGAVVPFSLNSSSAKEEMAQRIVRCGIELARERSQPGLVEKGARAAALLLAGVGMARMRRALGGIAGRGPLARELAGLPSDSELFDLLIEPGMMEQRSARREGSYRFAGGREAGDVGPGAVENDAGRGGT